MARSKKAARNGVDAPLLVKVEGFVRALACDAKTGRVVAEHRSKNKVVDGGRDLIVKLISTGNGNNPGGVAISHAQVGTGTTATDATHTDLLGETGTARKAVTVTTAATGAVQYAFSFDTSDANTAIAEVGLFNNSATNAGTMFARATHGVINKDNTMTLAYTYQLNFVTTT